MNVKFETVDGTLVVKPQGSVNSTNSKEFGQMVLDGIKDASSVKMDMVGLEYISSAGLREILLVAQKLIDKDVPLVIINIAPEIKSVFDVTGFSEMLNIE